MDHAQKSANSVISLVVNNVISVLIGLFFWPYWTLIMDSLGEGARPFSGSVTRPCPFPVMGNGHSRVPSPRESMFKVHDGHRNGPIRSEMTLLTTNEIAELVVFYGWSLTQLANFKCQDFWPPIFICLIPREDSYGINKNAAKYIDFWRNYTFLKLGHF